VEIGEVRSALCDLRRRAGWGLGLALRLHQ
jgi:hypothetical protein